MVPYGSPFLSQPSNYMKVKKNPICRSTLLRNTELARPVHIKKFNSGFHRSNFYFCSTLLNKDPVFLGDPWLKL